MEVSRDAVTYTSEGASGFPVCPRHSLLLTERIPGFLVSFKRIRKGPDFCSPLLLQVQVPLCN